MIGVLAPSRVLLVGRTLAALGAKRAFVVHGTDGIDELTTTGESIVARVEESETGGKPTLKAARVTPEMAGLPRATLDQFTGGDVETNAALALRRADRHSRRAAGYCAAECGGGAGGRGTGRRSEGRRRAGRRGHRLRPGGGDAGKAAAVWGEVRRNREN